MARPRPRRSRPNSGGIDLIVTRRRRAYQDAAAEEWREELLEAADAGERSYLGHKHKVLLGPVIPDLEPEQRRWFLGLLEQTQDTSEQYVQGLPYREQQIMFRTLDEQINNAGDEQILEYKRQALEA